jgi:putative transposase
VKRAGVRISIAGKGQFLDNIFIERLWLLTKYERVFLHAWESGSEAKNRNQEMGGFHNHKRSQSALGGKPPAVVSWQRNETIKPDQQGKE